MSDHPYLRRFRVDPEKVRVSIRRSPGGNWIAIVASRHDPSGCRAWYVSSSPERAGAEAPWLAEDAHIPGIDLAMDWVYPHPQLTSREEREARGMTH